MRNRAGVEELARRFEKGLDLWTGQPLARKDVPDWYDLRFGLSEEELDDDELADELEAA